MNPAFWNGKRVLLTGHTGFKGSWLALWLQSMGCQVVGYALAPPTTPSLFEVTDETRETNYAFLHSERHAEKLKLIQSPSE
jgi:CDP-glucose 4,6-dehydratase